MNITPTVSNLNTFNSVSGWITRFEIDGIAVGGDVNLHNDDRLLWQLEQIGGVENKRILELGPLDGGHTLTMIEHGASRVTAIEGYHPSWIRCLIVKELFNLNRVKFLYGDFCPWIKTYNGQTFDVVVCNGVFYHQLNPAELLFDLAKIAKVILLGTHIYEEGITSPCSNRRIVYSVPGFDYEGFIQDYGQKDTVSGKYCGGINQTSTWVKIDTLRAILRDAGFKITSEIPIITAPNGRWITLVATC
jgi:SAM-dependent methyltransferase